MKVNMVRSIREGEEVVYEAALIIKKYSRGSVLVQIMDLLVAYLFKVKIC